MDITSAALLHIGLSPTDSFDEAIADMIVGGVEDFFQALIKVFIEKEEAKKVPNKHNFVFLFPLLYNLYHFSLQISIPCSHLTFRCLLFASTFRSVPPVFAPLTACPIVLLSALSFPFLVWSTNFLITLPLPYFFRWCYHWASNVSLPSTFSLS